LADGGGFKALPLAESWAGVEVLVQELFRHGKSGQELGFYNAFMIGRRYVSLFAAWDCRIEDQLARFA
jgi:hypothetical protein